MKALLDTSFLVAALVEAHPRHPQAFPWLPRLRRGEVEAVLATHAIAEADAVLSSLPTSPRIGPVAAWALLEHGVLPFAEAVDLSAIEVQHVIRRMSQKGLSGGVVYDALIAAAGLKARADCMVTLHPADFRRVVEEDGIEIREP
jgi:predicted nucleic acid-binding protein